MLWVIYYLHKSTRFFLKKGDSVQIWYPVIELFKEILVTHWMPLQAIFKDQLPSPNERLKKVRPSQF